MNIRLSNRNYLRLTTVRCRHHLRRLPLPSHFFVASCRTDAWRPVPGTSNLVRLNLVPYKNASRPAATHARRATTPPPPSSTSPPPIPNSARLIQRAGPFTLRIAGAQSPFEALVESIVYQQLHGKAAATIHRRLLEPSAPRSRADCGCPILARSPRQRSAHTPRRSRSSTAPTRNCGPPASRPTRRWRCATSPPRPSTARCPPSRASAACPTRRSSST